MRPTTRRVLHVSGLALILSPPLAAQSLPARLDEYLSARARLGQFNGTALVAHEGSVLLEKGYGLANVEHRVPAGRETRYLIASITKNFTDAAILRLQEDGRLATTDSLCRWVTSCPDAWRPVTLAHLMHHTSGIPDYESALELGSIAYADFMGQSRSAERIVEAARLKPLEFAPGSKFKYSNTGYVLLGYVIERAAGKPFSAVLSERVLAPAGVGTMTFVSRSTVVPQLASGYRRVDMDFATAQAGVTLDARTLNVEPAPPLDGPHGDANLIATANELWRWTQAMADSTALRPTSIREMFTPGLGTYGEGWFIGSRFGRRMAWHTGALPGYVSVIEFYPESRTTIVLLSNTTGIRLSTSLRDLAAVVFGQPYDIPVARRLLPFDSVAARPLVGEYALSDGATATVSLDRGMLGLKIPGRFEIGAFPMGPDEFYAPFFDNTVRFGRAANGSATQIAFRINGATLTGTRK